MRRMKDNYTQTSDKEEGSDYELSAMEKDILMCTGCRPGKLRKLQKLNSITKMSSSKLS